MWKEGLVEGVMMVQTEVRMLITAVDLSDLRCTPCPTEHASQELCEQQRMTDRDSSEQ